MTAKCAFVGLIFAKVFKKNKSNIYISITTTTCLMILTLCFVPFSNDNTLCSRAATVENKVRMCSSDWLWCSASVLFASFTTFFRSVISCSQRGEKMGARLVIARLVTARARTKNKRTWWSRLVTTCLTSVHSFLLRRKLRPVTLWLSITVSH